MRLLLRFTALIGAILFMHGAAVAQTPAQDEWRIDPLRGPVDIGLTDPSLVGAIDVHLHLDPDAPGASGAIRAIDVFDAAKIAQERGMRGFVFKTHQDTSSASGAYMVRKHVSPSFEIFGRMASNYATGGINVATPRALLPNQGRVGPHLRNADARTRSPRRGRRAAWIGTISRVTGPGC